MEEGLFATIYLFVTFWIFMALDRCPGNDANANNAMLEKVITELVRKKKIKLIP